MSNATRTDRTLFLTRFSILLALEIIVCFTPLGTIPIGPIAATLSMVPVIVTAIVLGPGAGSVMGGFFGLFSFLVMSFIAPGPTSFVFTPLYSAGSAPGNGWSLVICFLPRILIGTVAGFVFQALKRRFSGKKIGIAYGLSGLLGSMTNTIGVLAGIYLFFGESYAEAAGIAYELLLGALGAVVLTNGIPEAIISTILAVAICQPLERMGRSRS